ncbi:hypothetical protein [Shinella zoogloeoides]|uniref:hypothetical protein n=1 Tax=Shinella zoogloeoides TaxID=352475 RepID=UPI00273EC2FD|nr:hypothetical protein [Shinella zoogloeoides]WLR90963.1 hypothetical protein Q9316_00875 [Shinella zoogloeoides]
MINFVRKMLNEAAHAGFQFKVDGGGDEPDYVGFHPALAEDAINAVDEAQVTLKDAHGMRMGWCLIVNGLNEDERIADAGSDDWIHDWCERNIR